MILSQLQWLGSANWQDDLYRMNQKDCGRIRSWPTLKCYSSICLEGLKKVMQYINHGSIYFQVQLWIL